MKLLSINLLEWLRPPLNFKNCHLMVMPIIISQILQRLYPVVDSRFINYLGNEALLIHSVQYNLIVFGQFIGMATGISCLIFWKRKECIQKQGSIFLKHVALVLASTTVMAFILGFFLQSIMAKYKVDQTYEPLSRTYLYIGLCNMILQAVYATLDGMLVASAQQKKAMCISFILLLANVLMDAIAINIIFSGNQGADSVSYPLIFIGISTTILMLIACLIATYLVSRKVQGWKAIRLSEIFLVWPGELGTYLIRGITPFIYALQLSYLKSSGNFLVTYQLVLQLSYILCLPLLAAMQLAIRNASEENSNNSNLNVPIWWNELLYAGLLPTMILLILGMGYPVQLCEKIYHYLPPNDHVVFIPLFLFICLIGQFANILTVPLRSRKKNYIITRNFILSEFIVMLGGTQFLIWFGWATPLTAGFAILLFVLAQLTLNLYFTLKLKRKERLV